MNYFLGPIYTRRANAHSTPTLLNSFSINRPRAFFRCSMEYSKNARLLDINAAKRETSYSVLGCSDVLAPQSDLFKAFLCSSDLNTYLSI